MITTSIIVLIVGVFSVIGAIYTYKYSSDTEPTKSVLCVMTAIICGFIGSMTMHTGVRASNIQQDLKRQGFTLVDVHSNGEPGVVIEVGRKRFSCPVEYENNQWMIKSPSKCREVLVLKPSTPKDFK